MLFAYHSLTAIESPKKNTIFKEILIKNESIQELNFVNQATNFGTKIVISATDPFCKKLIVTEY